MITPAAILITAVLAVLLLSLPRKHFLLPYVVAACFVPTDQRVIIFGLDFTVLRMLVVVGVVAVMSRGMYHRFAWTRFDKLVIVWALSGALIYVLRWGSVSAMIYKSGVLFDVIGMYWLFRMAVRDWDDVYNLTWIFAFCALISCGFIVYERVAQRNPFEFLGRTQTGMHRGRYRCCGPFPHSIMMGLFWATLVPLFLMCFKKDRGRKLFWGAVIASCLLMVFLSGSSTPFVTVVGVIGLYYIYNYRSYGRSFIWLLVIGLIVLDMVMQAPVWHLISRIDVFGGSTGWHRYHLINEAIRHFGEWAVLGTRSTGHWGSGLQDITNQYILEGVRGGFVTLVLFCVLLGIGIKSAWGYSIRPIPREQRWGAWAVAVAMIGHCISFLGVSYFGQIMMLLYLTFAMVGMVYAKALQPVRTHGPAQSRTNRDRHGSIHSHRQLEHSGHPEGLPPVGL